MLETPVALIIFRRPEFTARVIESIAQVKPRTLFVIADGPRADRPEDIADCAAARAVIDRIDWDCDVRCNYSDVNLGCGRRPVTGISWVFEHVEEAIILEDDCVPDPSFFPFCSELLKFYRDDQRIMNISGMTSPRQLLPVDESFFFSKFAGTWGWATWKRAWRCYDPAVNLWPTLRRTSWLADLLKDAKATEFLAGIFDRTYEARGNVSYWDYQWLFCCWANSGLSIVPRANLVSNIGWGKEATHTMNPDDSMANNPVLPMAFPLHHPPVVLRDRDLDWNFLGATILPSREERIPVMTRLRSLAFRISPAFVRRIYRKIVSSFHKAPKAAEGDAPRPRRRWWGKMGSTKGIPRECADV